MYVLHLEENRNLVAALNLLLKSTDSIFNNQNGGHTKCHLTSTFQNK